MSTDRVLEEPLALYPLVPDSTVQRFRAFDASVPSSGSRFATFYLPPSSPSSRVPLPSSSPTLPPPSLTITVDPTLPIPLSPAPPPTMSPRSVVCPQRTPALASPRTAAVSSTLVADTVRAALRSHLSDTDVSSLPSLDALDIAQLPIGKWTVTAPAALSSPRARSFSFSGVLHPVSSPAPGVVASATLPQDHSATLGPSDARPPPFPVFSTVVASPPHLSRALSLFDGREQHAPTSLASTLTIAEAVSSGLGCGQTQGMMRSQNSLARAQQQNLVASDLSGLPVSTWLLQPRQALAGLTIEQAYALQTLDASIPGAVHLVTAYDRMQSNRFVRLKAAALAADALAGDVLLPEWNGTFRSRCFPVILMCWTWDCLDNPGFILSHSVVCMKLVAQ
jgi:hypothetical protein